jgi:hypothetical protein
VDVIEVKLASMDQFVRRMQQLLVNDFPRYGWKLLSATYHLTGRPDIVMHVWEIPSADSLRDTMIRLGENPTYLELQQYVVSEQQHLLSRMVYDPNASPLERAPGDRATETLMRHAAETAARTAGAGGEQPEVTSARSAT